MFRVNVYRLVDERRRRTVQRAKRLAVLSVLAGLTGVSLLFLALVVVMQGRELAAVEAALTEAKRLNDEQANVGRMIPRSRYAFLERKVEQTIWSDALAALAERLPEGVRLREVRLVAPASKDGGNLPTVVMIMGSVAVHAGLDPTGTVVRLNESLQSDERITRAVCELRIGSADASPYDPQGTYDFELVGRACLGGR